MGTLLQGDLLSQLTALAQVLFIDLALAGDNAVVVGMAVAGLPPERKRTALLAGIAAAALLRMGLALVAVQLLAIIGLTLAGGLLLLWVCWRMFRELRPHRAPEQEQTAPPKSFGSAMVQILLADLSMSLDNVLAVAGAAREHPWVLVLGLAISVVLMGAAAGLVARVLDRYRWLAWVGLLIVFYIALRMIWEGGHEVVEAVR